MNWAWWDGKMTLHHYRDEHGLDGATLAESVHDSSAEPEAVEVAAEQQPETEEMKHGR